MRYGWLFLGCAALCVPVTVIAQAPTVFSEADHLRGSYGPYRANNDLLYYHLDVRVDPNLQTLSGKNSIRFKMLKDGSRIQLDLVPVFQIEKILLDRPNAASIFDEYLRHAAITTLELRFDEDAHTVSYRWRAEEQQFAMPVRVGLKSGWQVIRPTTAWQRMNTNIAKDDFEVATDLYYINVSKQ
jgi:hypothetical protein